LDSRFSCHSDVDASKFASSKAESTSSLEPESLDGAKCSSALDSSPIATPKLVASSGVAQGDSNGKGASHSLELILPNRISIAPFASKMGIPWSFAFVVSSMSDVCMLKLLRSHVAFLMARAILIWAPSQVLGSMLLALSPKGLLTYMRMVIRPLEPCLSIGLCTIALIVGRMGIK
jgi:hypothetical protein